MRFPSDLISALVTSGGVIILFVLLHLAVGRLGRQATLRLVARSSHQDATARAETMWAMAGRLLSIATVVTVVLVLMGIWGVPIAPLIAVGSAVAVAVGLGAQTVVRDVIAGFFILAEDQYHLGQLVSIGEVSGKVIDVRPRVTVLAGEDGTYHFIPNGEIKLVSNHSKPDR